MEALQGLGDWLTLSQQPPARRQERQRLSTASLGREISDVPLPRAGRRRSARGGGLDEHNAGAGGEDVVTLASNVQEGRLVRLTRAYERSIQEHVQQGIVNAHERFIGRVGRVVKVNIIFDGHGSGTFFIGPELFQLAYAPQAFVPEMEVAHSQSARLRPLLPGHAHSAVPSPHAQAVFLASPPTRQPVDADDDDASPPAVMRGSAVVNELVNMGFQPGIADRASRAAPDISAAVEEAIRLSSVVATRSPGTHTAEEVQQRTDQPTGAHIPSASFLLRGEEHGLRTPATPSTPSRTPSRIPSNVSSVVWQERPEEVVTKGAAGEGATNGAIPFTTDMSTGADASASEAELLQYRRQSSSSLGADAYLTLDTDKESLEAQEDNAISMQRSSFGSADAARRQSMPEQSVDSIHDRLDQLRKRRQSLLSESSPGPNSSSHKPIEGTTPVAAPAKARNSKAPVLLVRPQSRTQSVDPTGISVNANQQSVSHGLENGHAPSPAANRRSLDASIESASDYPLSARKSNGARSLGDGKRAEWYAATPPAPKSEAQGPEGLQQTSRAGQEPLVASHKTAAPIFGRNGESPILSSSPFITGPGVPVKYDAHVAQKQGPQQANPPGLGMRVKENADGTVYINYMQNGGAAAAADPFLKVGDRVISIGGVAVKSEQDVKRLCAGPDGTPIILHCSRGSERLDGGRPKRQSLVCIITLVRGMPGAHQVHTQRVNTNDKLASANASIATWVPSMMPVNKPQAEMLDCPPSAPLQQSSSDAEQLLVPSQNNKIDDVPPLSLPAVDQMIDSEVQMSPSTMPEGNRDEPQNNFSAAVTNQIEAGDTVIVLTGQALGSTGRLVSISNDEAVVRLEHGLSTFKVDDIRLLEPRAPQLAPLARTKKPATPSSSHESLAPAVNISQENCDAEVWSIPSESSPTPRISPPSDIIGARELGLNRWRQELEDEVGRTAADALFTQGRSDPPSLHDQQKKRELVCVAESQAATFIDHMQQHAVTPKVNIRFRDLMLMAPPIGTGTNKTVYKATWRSTVVVSAAQQFRKDDCLALSHEVGMLKKFGKHPYLPQFHGVAKDDEGKLYLVCEFFPLGSLDVQLEIWEDRLSIAVRLCLASQICEAMTALHQMEILHRDLATRNVLVHSVDADNISQVWVKVSDFGLACYGKEARGKTGEVPWRWTGPEVMEQQLWCQATDVWAFAVTLWEIFTNALIPYSEISEDEELQRRVFGQGLRLDRPPQCPDGVWEVMERSWQHDHTCRNSFEEIAQQLLSASSAHLADGPLFVM